MNAEIINVGDEILSGNTLNVNFQTLCSILLSLGVTTDFNTVVGDVDEHIVSATEIALKRSDLVIYTGGLGPTRDDLTKEVVCKTINRDLVLNDEILRNIEGFFKLREIEMTENNIKQAYVPKDGIILKNKNGTAPGIFLRYNDKFIVLLPGPPREMEPMFVNEVVPLLKNLIDTNILSKTIKTIGIGESRLETRIEGIILQYKDIASIATYAKSGLVDIRISIKALDKSKADIVLNEICEKIDSELKQYIYSCDNQTIEEVVFDLLKERGLKVGFCESCTGGLVSSKITKLSGSSEVFDRGIVTYSNRAKVEEVGVKQDTLDKYGAVSSQTATEMAVGLLNKANLDIAVSLTGIAGPTGGSDDKPIGLVYICLATKSNKIVEKNIFIGNRNYIQEKASLSALNLIRNHILTSMYK